MEKFVRKVELTKTGIVKVTIRGLVERDGQKFVTKEIFVGKGMSIAEATGNAIIKMNLI